MCTGLDERLSGCASSTDRRPINAYAEAVVSRSGTSRPYPLHSVTSSVAPSGALTAPARKAAMPVSVKAAGSNAEGKERVQAKGEQAAYEPPKHQAWGDQASRRPRRSQEQDRQRPPEKL